MSDPKKVNPRFAAVAEELAPPPPPPTKAQYAIGPPARGVNLSALPTVDVAKGAELGSIARAHGLLRRAGETDDELRARCQLLLGGEAEPSAFGTELRRIRDGGRLCLMFEWFILQPVSVDRSPYATQETYEGFDGNARLRITILREESVYNEPVYGAGGYVGNIRRRGGY